MFRYTSREEPNLSHPVTANANEVRDTNPIYLAKNGSLNSKGKLNKVFRLTQARLGVQSKFNQGILMNAHYAAAGLWIYEVSFFCRAALILNSLGRLYLLLNFIDQQKVLKYLWILFG